VRRGAFLVLLLFAFPVTAEAQSGSPVAAEGWNPRLAAQVYGAAFAFMAPRTLNAIPMANLTLWGLRGLTALDPLVGPTLSSTAINLISRNQTVLTLPLPPPTDAASWGNIAATLCDKATQVSPAIASAGTTGIVTSFFDELFNHLDPYSRYIAPGDSDPDRLSAGPGFALGSRGRGASIESVDPSGPAATAGLAVGDRVLSIDGHRTRGQALSTLDNWLGGAPGSTADLVILPQGSRRPVHIAVPRAALLPETVFPALQNGILTIQIAGFERNTAQHLRQAIASSTGNVRGIVLDLRGNRGGLLDQAVAIAGTLVVSGTIASTIGRDPAANQLWRGSGVDTASGLPIIVLVDGRTGRAAKMVAAGLDDNRRAVVVGSATLGKGLVQTGTALPDGGDLLVTWARVLAPLGWPLQGLGVMPQVCTSGGADQVEAALQSLADGTQVLAGALNASRAARPGISLSRILQIRQACPAALGSALDSQAAQFLLTTPAAYAAAQASLR
jgi:carboxyl-terminal processing protease